MSKLSSKGVVVGGITDIVATSIFAIPVIVYLMTKVDFAHMSTDQVQAAITSALHANTPLYALQLLIGMACSVLGGYVGARLAKHDELLNGALTSFLCVALGLYALNGSRASRSLLMDLMGFVISPGLGLLGGYLRLAQKRATGTTLQPTRS